MAAGSRGSRAGSGAPLGEAVCLKGSCVCHWPKPCGAQGRWACQPCLPAPACRRIRVRSPHRQHHFYHHHNLRHHRHHTPATTPAAPPPPRSTAWLSLCAGSTAAASSSLCWWGTLLSCTHSPVSGASGCRTARS